MLDRTTELKRAADFYVMKRLLRLVAISSIGAGIASVIGFLTFPRQVVSATTPILGIVAVALGIWILKAPSPIVFAAEACECLVMWIPSALRTSSAVHQKTDLPWQCTMVMSLFLAGVLFGEYKRFAYLRDYDPSSPDCVKIGYLMWKLAKGNPEGDASLIEIISLNKKWVAKLTDDGALFADRMGFPSWGARDDIVFAGKDELAIEKRGNVFLGKSIKVTLHFGARELKGAIRPEYLERLEAWKSAVTEAPRPF